MSAKKKNEIDIFTLEIIRSGLISLSREMGLAMSRTAYSVIFSEGYDFSCAIFDAKAEMVAQAEFNPVHLGAMAFAVEWCLKEIGIENLEPGDVVLHNDPFRGGTHITDFTIIMPVFDDKGNLVAIPANRAHLLDIGGKSPGGFGGDSTEVYQEGVTIPPVFIQKRGKPVTDIWKIILSNVRVPKPIYGDFQAMIGSLEIGKRRIHEYIEKYGVDTFQMYMEEIKDYSEKRIRSEIAKLPQGTYEAEDFLDDDGIKAQPIKLKVAVSVMGDTFVADFTGSDPQVEGPINATYGVAASQTYNAVFNLTDPYIPSNHGCFRAIKIIAPGGTIVNADHPAATFGGNVETSSRIVDVIMAAMSKVVPEKVAAGCYGTCHNCTGGGTDPRKNNDPFCWYLFREGGWGGRATKDGNDSLMDYVGNDMNQPIEVLENSYPWLLAKYELVNDCMGPGKFRGGMGTNYTIEFLNDDTRLNIITDKCNQAPFGLFGGLPPVPREECGHYNDIRVKMDKDSEFKHITEVFGAVSASKAASMRMPKGSTVELMTYGGGGYGNPLERDPKKVQWDVKNEKVSLKNAKIYYGVLLDPKTLEIDAAGTEKLRKEMLEGGKSIVK